MSETVLRGLPVQRCKHGVPLFEKDAECIDCDIAWEKDCIRSATESLTRHHNNLDALEAKKKGANK